MTDKLPFSELREQAITLRRAGRSRREIQQILQIRSNARLNDVLRGEPPQPRTRRPNAKDDLRARARELREQGLDYEEIAAKLGVAKSSVSLWVRDLPRPERLSYEQCRKRSADGVAAYWAQERVEREASRAAVSSAAASQIGQLTDREILIAGAIAYWCEGTKNKPYRRTNRVTFINSDPLLIGLYLRFLQAAGVTRDRLVFRVSIHDSADHDVAQAFWLQVTQADPTQFRKPSLKRHSPVTVRKNTDDGYHGCLRIDVLKSATLYRQIEGWASAVMTYADS